MARHCQQQAQLDRESKMFHDGRTRFHDAKKRILDHGDVTDAHNKIMRGALPLVAKGVEKFLSGCSSEGVGRRHVALEPLKELEPSLVAFIGLMVSFAAVANSYDVRKTCLAIGRHIEEELWALGFEADDPKRYKKLIKKVIKDHARRRIRKRALKTVASKEGYGSPSWSDMRRVKVGAPVLSAVLEEAGVFEMFTNPSAPRRRLVGLTPEASQVIRELEQIQQWMEPVYRPMIVRPRNWVGLNAGAYLDPKMRALVPLVRTYSKDTKARIKGAIKDGSMQSCLDAVNIIQSTRLAINTKVFELVAYHWAQGTLLPKFPKRHYLPKIEFPENYEELDSKEKKLWRLKARRVIEHNRAIDSNHALMAQDLMSAEELSGQEAFWLPANLDFRSRVYAVPHFNHQRADYIKAMIQFSEGKPLGKDGAYWLAIHCANVGDFDKISKRGLGARIEWVVRNKERIIQLAADPYACDWWMAADKPFSFLAACFEMAGLWQEGHGFVSHLAIALDGSVSGIQHYSAALRDKEGGRAVNLLDMEEPQDLYQEVAELNRKSIEAERGKDPMAKLWLDHGIDRSVVKRNVMTYAYSSEQFGFKQQLMEDLMGPLSDRVLEGRLGKHPFGDDDGNAAAGYIAKKTWAAVNNKVKKASEGMAFLKLCASLMAHEKKAMAWTTPLGFPVLQSYQQWDHVRVEIFLYDRSLPLVESPAYDESEPVKTNRRQKLARITANMRTKAKETISKKKARNAVAPNFIHSLDATHLMMTVLAAAAEGIDSFSLIHDSFGTHAADTERFFSIIREAFVALYTEHDPFDAIYRGTYSALSEKGRAKLERPPKKGDLDLNEVLGSLYSFA